MRLPAEMHEPVQWGQTIAGTGRALRLAWFLLAAWAVTGLAQERPTLYYPQDGDSTSAYPSQPNQPPSLPVPQPKKPSSLRQAAPHSYSLCRSSSGKKDYCNELNEIAYKSPCSSLVVAICRKVQSQINTAMTLDEVIVFYQTLREINIDCYEEIRKKPSSRTTLLDSVHINQRCIMRFCEIRQALEAEALAIMSKATRYSYQTLPKAEKDAPIPASSPALKPAASGDRYILLAGAVVMFFAGYGLRPIISTFFTRLFQ